MFGLFCVGIFSGCIVTLASCGEKPNAIESRGSEKESVT